MVSRRGLLIGGLAGAGALAAGGGAVAWAYSRDIAAAEARTSVGSVVVPSRFGALEYAEAGEGAPILMIHGTGGFDQGLAFCHRLVASGHRVIAPSRFGYLRSDFPADPSSEAQADALVDLLDHLGIDRIPVAGGSAGALPALPFAIRHPDRCSALIALVPATYVPGRPITPGPTGLAADAMGAMLASDLLFWGAMQVMPGQMIGTMLATDPDLVAAAAPEERARVAGILRDILPVSHRTRGLLNDARLASNPAPMELARIVALTLAISVEDDRFGTADAARYIAATVPGARLIIYPSGGHVWVGHDAEVFETIHQFLAALPA